MDPPQLPTELIVTIAEFLAGSFAYGSLARLNLATRAVHEATLPVLFDTVVWETNRRWWIYEGGHVPRGWGYTRYLVMMDRPSKSVHRYLSSLLEDDVAEIEPLSKIFPRLVMTITKRTSDAFQPTSPVADLICTVYKPISVSAFLLVCTTRKFRCATTYFGAEVEAPDLPPIPDYSNGLGEEDVVLEERIARVSLKGQGKITGTAVERVGWYGIHQGRKDLVFSADDNGNNWSMWEVKESLETLLGSIPPRRSDDLEPYYMVIKGFAVSDLGVIADIVEALNTHVFLKIPVYPMSSGFSRPDTLAIFEQHLTAISHKYAEEWHRLPLVGTGEILLRVYYEEIYRQEDIDMNNEDFAEDCVVVGTLMTRGSLEDVEDEEGYPYARIANGFELTIKRFSYDDWLRLSEDDDGEVEAEELFGKSYEPIGAVFSSDEDTE